MKTEMHLQADDAQTGIHNEKPGAERRLDSLRNQAFHAQQPTSTSAMDISTMTLIGLSVGSGEAWTSALKRILHSALRME